MTKPLALITGVGRTVGIAASIARTLATDGWDLALTHWSPADEAIFGVEASAGLDGLLAELRGLGARVEAFPVDLEQPDAAASLFASVRALGSPTALVMSHAWDIESDILTTTVDEFDKHFAINARASWLLVREFALLGGPGAIVALTSDHTTGNLRYGASKGALDRIVVSAAKEFASLGISANVVNPGPIDTGWMDAATREWLTGMQPSGRLGTGADTANLVAFLVSERGRWVTGQLIKSDGGFSLTG